MLLVIKHLRIEIHILSLHWMMKTLAILVSVKLFGFSETRWAQHPKCYITRPKVIGLLVLEKKIFKGFLPYMGVAAIFVM